MMQANAAVAIRLKQHQMRWRENSAFHQLRKRKKKGHLPADATLAEYEQIICSVKLDQAATVLFADWQ